MADSLRASAAGLDLVDQARRQRRWNKTASTWYQQAFTSRSTLNRFWAGQAIRSEAFISLCDIVGVPWQQVAEMDDVNLKDLPALIQPKRDRIHWGEAPDSQFFYGREQELATLTDWVSHCRLILIHGMGGMGKTILTARLVSSLLEDTNHSWDWMVWRSLRNAPPLDQLLEEILETIEPNLYCRPNTLHEAELRLLEFLRSQRGLLVLDNLETILSSQLEALERQESSYDAGYGAGYEDYETFFRLLGSSSHQSCLILTSREVPKGWVNQTGEQLPVRCFPLAGLQKDAALSLFESKGIITGADREWHRILNHYAGNPLALKIVATSVCDFFEGNLSGFLDYLHGESILFDDIKDLLDRQFERLSLAEKAVMYWLAVNRESVSLLDLQQDICHLSKGEVLAALSCLRHRSLVEAQSTRFTQQPVVMEYVLAKLIEAVSQAILRGDAQSSVLRHYALAKAQAKDYIYNIQVKFILMPVLNRLYQHLTPDGFLKQAHHLIQQWRQAPHLSTYGAGNLINLARAGNISLQGFDFSSLPITQANLQGIDLHKVSFADADLSSSVFTEMIGNVLSASFSSNGQILGTSDNSYRIRLWDVKTGQLLNICQGHQHWIRSVCFSPKQAPQALLASGSADYTIRIWDVTTGTEVQLLSGHLDEVFCVSFCPEGTKVMSASGDRTIRLWDIGSGDCLHVFEGHTDRVRTITCGGQTTLASGDECGVVRIWNLYTGDRSHEIIAHTGWVRALAFDTKGTTLVSGGNDGMVRLWDAASGQLKREWLAHSGGVYALSFSTQGNCLATGGADHQIRLWSLENGSCLTTISGHGNQIYSVTFSPDSQLLAGVSLDQTVKLWDWQHNLCLKTWRGYTDWGFPVDISPDGQRLISGSGANTLHVWDTKTQECLQALSGFPGLIRAVVMMPQNQLAVAGADPVIQIWNWQTQHCLRQLQGHRDWVLNLALTETNETLYLASCSADHSIRLWDVATGKALQVLLGHDDQVNAIAFSSLPQSPELLASGSSDHQVRVWNWQTGVCLKTLEGHCHRVYSVRFHPFEPFLMSAGADRTIRVWELESGNCIQSLTGHEGWIFAIAVSSCGKYLLSGGQDQSVKLWDLSTAQCIRSFVGHRHQVYSVMFGPDGEWFASGSQDQTVRIWDIATGQCRFWLSSRLYEGMNITGTKGLSMAQRRVLEELGATSGES